MSKLDKIKNLLFKKKKKPETIKAPEKWFQQTKKGQIIIPKTEGVIELEVKKHKKFHVPGLRTAKRVLAGFLLIINFFISQATLMSAATSQPLFWLFFLNSFIILDYIWKTRNKPQVIEEWQTHET